MLKSLGKNIRNLRKEKGITLVEISKKTGVAQATLSRIETGTMTGTIESHEKIAEVLGISLAELFMGVDSRRSQVAHQSMNSARKVTHHSKNIQVELLTQESSKKKITPLMITLQGRSESEPEKNERGVEKFVYQLEGETKVSLDSQEYFLREGETLYFDASLPHHFINEGIKPARLLAAVSPSKL